MKEQQNELVVMVGLPASGKSTVSRDYQRRGYHVVNPDSIRLRFGVQYSGEIEKDIKKEQVLIPPTREEGFDQLLEIRG